MDWLVGHLMTRQPPDRTGLKDKKNYISFFVLFYAYNSFSLLLMSNERAPLTKKKGK